LNSDSMVVCVFKDFGYPEISKFYSIIAGKEHILRLDISVHDLTPMYVFECETQLHEPIHNLCLSEKFTLSSPFLDMKGEISHFAEFHDDHQKAFINETPFIRYYIWVRKIFK